MAEKRVAFLKAVGLAFTCGFVFAFLINLLRFLINLKFSIFAKENQYFLGLLAGLPTQAIIGTLLALPLYWSHRSKFRFICVLLLGFVLFANIASFHYETTFLSLPGIDALYYLADLKGLSTSVSRSTPVIWVLTELIVSGVVLWLIFRRLAVLFEAINTKPRLLLFFNLAMAILLVSGHWTAQGNNFGMSYYWGSREPFTYLYYSLGQRMLESDNQKITPEEIKLIKRKMGGASDYKPLDENYPLCVEKRSNKKATPNGRNVIMVLLEGISNRELDYNYQGVRLMPNLARIASENLTFNNIFSGSSQSIQTYPAIFSGQPAQTATELLKYIPMVNLTGFPEVMRQNRYETSVLYGGNLSFSNVETFLKMVGINKIRGIDPEANLPVYGWGYSDEVMFSRTKDWIARQRQENPGQPYFVCTLTASTHDPYELPDDYKRLFSREDTFSRFADSAHYLDAKLADFYQWYLKEEYPKGTLLVITGDHGPRVVYPDMPIETNTGEIEYQFEVPLIIAGLGNEEKERFLPYSNRYGSHIDLPATLLGLLGLGTLDCSIGLNLLAEPEDWNDDRFILSVAPVDLRFIYIQNKNYRWMYDRNRKVMLLHDTDKDPMFQQNIIEMHSDLIPEVEKFLYVYRKFNIDLLKNNTYTPENLIVSVERQIVPRVRETIFISNQGNIAGPSSADKENNLNAIKRAYNAGFKWVKINIDVTKDRVPVLVHDTYIHDSKIVTVGGEKKYVEQFTLDELRAMPEFSGISTLDEVLKAYGTKLNFLIEVNKTYEIIKSIKLAEILAEVVKKRPQNQEIVFTSYSPLVPTSVKNQASSPTSFSVSSEYGVDSKLLKYLSRAGFDWICFDYNQANPQMIADAHKNGLKVILRTVNEPAFISGLGEELPDAVITDSADIMLAHLK